MLFDTDLFDVMFAIVFFLIIGTFIFIIIKSISEWRKNNNSPRITVPATVVAKRTSVSSSHKGSSSTWYYVTFQLESGDRMELCLKGSDYAMIAEKDFGDLSFQGTRFLGFVRK